VTASASGDARAGPARAGASRGRTSLPVPLVVAGIRAALAAAGAGLAIVTILVLIGWIAAPHPGIGLTGVLRTAAVVWLAGHHVTVQVSGAGRIGMLPLGLVALPGALLWRGGRALARGRQVAGPGQVAAVALCIAVPYALLAAALALASGTELAAASAPQALLAGFGVALVGAGFGAARALAPAPHVGDLLSPRTRAVLTGMTASLALLAAAGLLATAMALASHLRQFSAAYARLDPGAAGAGLLLLIQLAYLPNAALWAVSYMLGPGFAVGTGTVVAPTGSVLGPVPAFPLLAALPSGPGGTAPAWLGAVILAVPYLAGAIGGLLVARIAPGGSADAAALRGFCSGALAGVLIGVLAVFAGGPLGDGRMSAVGPSGWQAGLVAALEIGISAAVAAGAARWRGARSPQAGSGARGEPAPGGPARARGRPGLDPADPADPHVICLDAWPAGRGDAAPRRRSRGPSSLP